MVLGGGGVRRWRGVRRGRRHLGQLWWLVLSSEPVEIEHSWALSAIGAVVGAGLLACGEAGGGSGRDLWGEAMGGGRGTSAGRSGIQGTDSRKVGNSGSALFFLFCSGAFVIFSGVPFDFTAQLVDVSNDIPLAPKAFYSVELSLHLLEVGLQLAFSGIEALTHCVEVTKRHRKACQGPSKYSRWYHPHSPDPWSAG